MTLNELHNLSSGLRSKLGKMNLYFKEAKRLCSNSLNIISGDACKMFASEKDDILPSSISLQVHVSDECFPLLRFPFSPVEYDIRFLTFSK